MYETIDRVLPNKLVPIHRNDLQIQQLKQIITIFLTKDKLTCERTRLQCIIPLVITTHKV